MKYCRLPHYIQNNVIDCFVENISVRIAAEKNGLHKNTIQLYYKKLRQIIFQNTNHYFFNQKISIGSNTYIPRKNLLIGIGRTNNIVSIISLSKLNFIRNNSELSPSFIICSKQESDHNPKISNLEMLKIQSQVEHYNNIEVMTFWSYIREKIKNNNRIPIHNLYSLLKEYEWRYNNSKEAQHLHLINWTNIKSTESSYIKEIEFA